MARHSSGSLRLFTVFGIDVFVHWTWFIAAAILFQFASRKTFFANSNWYLLVYLTLFGIVLLHEFGHALACRSVGGQANTIVLWPLGGIAFVKPPPRPWPMLWSIAAGPLVNVALVPVTVLIWAFVIGLRLDVHTDSEKFVTHLFVINLSLLFFNLLPVYPLDGGQIVQSILWIFLGRARSLKITAGFGLLCAVVGGVLMLILHTGWWLIVMVVFIGLQSWQGLRMARVLEAMESAEVDP